jgi:transcription initiation factor TFIIB
MTQSVIPNSDLFSCPECNGNIIYLEERGDSVCIQCGLIAFEKEIDRAHMGRRAFTKQQKQKIEQIGSPISELVPNIGLCTYIDKYNIQNSELHRAAKRDSYLSWEDRNLVMATAELKRISHNLNLPAYIKKEGLKLYKRAFKANILRGRSIKSMIVACLYYTCKLQRIPRTFQEFQDESSQNQKKIKNCYKTLIQHFNLKTVQIDPISLLSRYITDLGLSTELEKFTTKILESYLKKKPLNGINPKGLCAGAIYVVCKLKNIKINQKTISNTINITEVTLRSRYKEIMEKLDFLQFF